VRYSAPISIREEIVMPLTIEQQEAQALDILPVVGEVEFNTYKEQLYAVNPDGGKTVFTRLLKAKEFARRLDMSNPSSPVVYLSRKA
jgi:hypothetical protein